MPTKKHKIASALSKAYVDLRCGHNEPFLTVPFSASGARAIQPAEVLRLGLLGALKGAELDAESAEFAAEAGLRDDDGGTRSSSRCLWQSRLDG